MQNETEERPFIYLCHESDPEWEQLRRTGVGGSESPILANLSTYGSWLSLALDKSGDGPAFEGNEFTRSGHRLEPVIGEWTLEEMAEEDKTADRPVRRGFPFGHLIRSKEHEYLTCTPDWGVRDFHDNGDPIEVPFQIKNTMLAARWDDGVPAAVMVQVQHELLVWGAPWGYVAALLTGNRLRWVRVDADPTLQEQILDNAATFWSLLREGGEMPIDGSEHTSRALKFLHPDDNGETVALDAELMEVAREFDGLKTEAKGTKAAIALATNRLQAALGDNTYGTFPDGSGFSFKTQTANIKAKEATTRKSRVLRRQGVK